MKRLLLVWSYLLILSLPIIYPFLLKGYFPTHDGGWAIVRLAEMHRELKEFQIPPRWSGYLNHGYGYPLFNFAYPAPYFFGELFHLAGLGVINSVKSLFILSILGSTAAMYLLSRRLWGTIGALISTALYLYAPYRFVNLYVRGSIGESMAFVFFPLLFYFFHEIFRKRTLFYYLITSITIAVFILTHNVMSILFMPVLVSWIVFLIMKNKEWKRDSLFALAILVNGLLLAAFFWIPALVEKKFIALSLSPLANKPEHFLAIADLFSRSWHFGIRPPLQVGILHIVVGIVGIVSIFMFGKKEKNFSLGFLLAILCIGTFGLLFPVSLPIWKLPLFKDIDFPWRVLGIVTFLLSLAGGAIGRIKFNKIATVVCVSAVLFFNLNYIKTQPSSNLPDSYYETNDATTTSADELMPVWVTKKSSDRPTEKITVVSKENTEQNEILDANISEISETATDLKFTVYSNNQVQATVNTLYFPGWDARVDGEKKEIEISKPSGLISVSVPSGTHNIELKFQNTFIRIFGNLVSLFGIIVVFGLWKFLKKLYL